MQDQTALLLAADFLLVVHALFIAFVVFGLVCILAGGLLQWNWVRVLWLRLAHLCCIAIVVVQAWLGIICPLTVWEMALRARAGMPTYEGTFIGYWLGRLIYYEAQPLTFAIIYTVFGTLVVVSWFLVPPRKSGQ